MLLLLLLFSVEELILETEPRVVCQHQAKNVPNAINAKNVNLYTTKMSVEQFQLTFWR